MTRVGDTWLLAHVRLVVSDEIATETTAMIEVAD